MGGKPTYEELKRRVQALKRELAESRRSNELLLETQNIIQVLDLAPFGLYLIDLSGKIVSCNKNGAERLGKTVQEAAGTLLRDYFPPEVSENRRLKGGEAVKLRRPVNFEDRIGEKWYQNTVAPIFDPDGRPIRLAICGIDVTEHKRALNALGESEEKYRNLVEESFDGIFIQKGVRITFTNKRLNEMLGYREGELVGREHWIVYHPDYKELTRERARRRMRGEDMVSRYEVKLLRKDGSSFYGEINARAITFPSDEKRGVQVWVKDIDQRKRVEKALRESEEKYRLLVENATDAIYVAQDGKIKFANPKALEMTGYTAEEMAEISFVDIIHPKDRDMVLERHLRRLKGEDIIGGYSFRILSRSGEVLSVDLNAVLIRWEGKPATLNFLRDITNQKKLEMQLQQAQKMEAIGTMAGGIAHDFNNLLMAIQGRASVVLMDKDASHPDFSHLKGIEECVGSGADLTKQLLGFARGGKYEVKPTDLNQFIRKESRMFGRTKKEIAIHEKYGDNLWPVEVDRGQFQQVLLNLYVNAWQAMPGGGDLYLETENVTLGENDVKPFSAQAGKYVRISVTDTGVGMDRATQKKIFDPFFTTKEMGRGTGLGLASVYGIVKNHGGFINVYSNKGYGSTFNIYLPATGKRVVQEKMPGGETLRGDEHILLVDDEPVVSEIAAHMLNVLGYRVMVAESGQKAVKIYAENRDRIDMVILDMIMPHMSGGETYDKLKHLNPDVKVLLSSGYSINGQATAILNRGCKGFIQKPFNIKELSQKVRDVLEKNSESREETPE
jgi:two-component system cell cycle sensor histidine kinase/response regulator CckA